MILRVLPCLVLSCNAVPFYARNSARISPVGWQACKLCPLKELPSGFGACTTFIHVRHDKFVDWKSVVFVPLKLSDKLVLGCINCVQAAWTSLLNRAFSFAYQCGHELPEPTKWQTQGIWRLWFLAFMWKLLCLSLRMGVVTDCCSSALSLFVIWKVACLLISGGVNPFSRRPLL